MLLHLELRLNDNYEIEKIHLVELLPKFVNFGKELDSVLMFRNNTLYILKDKVFHVYKNVEENGVSVFFSPLTQRKYAAAILDMKYFPESSWRFKNETYAFTINKGVGAYIEKNMIILEEDSNYINFTIGKDEIGNIIFNKIYTNNGNANYWETIHQQTTED
jgi:hypothetical protein